MRYGLWQAAAAYVGSVIGAGLASGQEIAWFFAAFGRIGLWGAMLTGLLMAAGGSMLAVGARKAGTRSHREFLATTVGEPLAPFLDGLLTVALLSTLAVMLSAGGAALYDRYGVDPRGGTALVALLTIAGASGGARLFLRLNTIVVPLLLLMLVAVTLPAQSRPAWQGPYTILPRGLVPHVWWASATVYAAYNLVLSVPLLASLGNVLPNSRSAAGAGALGGLVIGGLIWLLTRGLLTAFPDAYTREIPMLSVAETGLHIAPDLYAAGLLAAVLTTAVASAFALGRRLKEVGVRAHPIAETIVVLAALPLAQARFESLVTNLYPLLGYAGMVLSLAMAGGMRPHVRRP